MADGRPDGGVRPDAGDIDDERLSLAMAALLGGAWPDEGPEGGLPAFTLPPPRRFDAVDQGGAPPATGAEPAPGEGSWAPPEPGAPAEAGYDRPPAGAEWAAAASAPTALAGDIAADPPAAEPLAAEPLAAAAEPLAAEPVAGDPWASIDEPTQAHTWTAADDPAPPAEPSPLEAPAPRSDPPPADDWWESSEDTGAVAAAATGAETVDPWSIDSLDHSGASGAEPADQEALELAGLAGPMNTALSDLRRVGASEVDATAMAAPVEPGGYPEPGKLAELQNWWSGRGRELLPGLAVAAVVVFAFAVVLLGRGSDDSKVDTGRVAVSTSAPPTTSDLSAVTEPVLDPLPEEPAAAPALSDAAPGSGAAVTPNTRRASPSVTRRPSGGVPAGGTKPTPTTLPAQATTVPQQTTTTEPQTTTTVAPDEPETPTRDRCVLLPDLCQE